MTSLTDEEYYQLTRGIGEAFNSIEAPVKSKHLRAVITSTCHSNGRDAFWAIAIRQPLQDNRITAWKFCHIIHKILREGHPLVIQNSMRHRNMITDMGKLWGNTTHRRSVFLGCLNDGYGLCIKQYSKLIVTKLNFHDRNPCFPGSLVLKNRGELGRIAKSDINDNFQLAVEMFDYLDDIVALQATIFNSVTTFTSMTSHGQCRLAPLVPCIQDSNQLYDFVVRLMFLLHANLPDDLLSGHRERFRTLFRQLTDFYKQAGQLQYFVNLIKVPSLPSAQPNFLVQSDLGKYTAPVVVVPQESNELKDGDNISIVENFFDTTFVEPELSPRSKILPHLPTVDFDNLLEKKDELIRHLQQEMERQQQVLRSTTAEKRQYEVQVQEHVAKINSELSQTKNELTILRIEKEEMELKMQTAPILEQKVLAESERAKTSEEKFQKLKNMYTQIRDEHIKLLRQHGEVTRSVMEATREKEELKSKMKVTETLQQSSSESVREKEELREKVKELEKEKISLMDQLIGVYSTKSAEIAELRINFATKLAEEKAKLDQEYQDVLSKKSETENSYQQTLISLERLQIVETGKRKLEQEIVNCKAENQSLLEKIDNKISEYEALETKMNETLQQTENVKQTLKEEIVNQKAENSLLLNQIEQKASEYKALEIKFNETLQKTVWELESLTDTCDESCSYIKIF